MKHALSVHCTIPACLVFAWMMFVYIGAKTPFDYFENTTNFLSPGEIADWHNETRRLHFSGFSVLNERSRWSAALNTGICFLPPHDWKATASSHVVVNIHLHDRLVNKPLSIKSMGNWHSRSCNSNECAVSVPISDAYKDGNAICVELAIPKATETYAGDMRVLGYKFSNLRYE